MTVRSLVLCRTANRKPKRYNKDQIFIICMMIQSPANTKLVETLAQVILTLTEEERKLLDQWLRNEQPNLSAFFDELVMLPADDAQPPIEEISQTVREVRRELWG